MQTALFVALVLLNPGGGWALGQNAELEAKLGTRVSQYSLSANGLADAVARVAKQFELPMGIEWMRNQQTLESLSLSWRGGTVRDILSSVIRKYPGYSFRVQHGVVHVFREDLVNDSHNFLNLKVPDSFEVRREVGGFANVRLREVAQNIVAPRKMTPGAGEGGSYATGIDEKPITVTLRGSTVREALERLADASEHKIWIVTFSDSPVLTSTGFRRTETLWHPAPFPDREQPMWDTYTWEEYPPR